jgi:hypothetical protein
MYLMRLHHIVRKFSVPLRAERLHSYPHPIFEIISAHTTKIGKRKAG